MSYEAEELHELERRAMIADRDNPWEAVHWRHQAEILRERLAIFDDCWAELMAASTNQPRAGQLAGMLGGYDGAQRVSRFAGALKGEGLISHSVFAEVQRKLSAPTPIEAKEMQDRAKENKMLDTTVTAILQAVGDDPEDRRRAMGLYNAVGGPRDNEKITQWVARLVEEKLLPERYKVSLRYGGLAVDKMLNIFTENK